MTKKYHLKNDKVDHEVSRKDILGTKMWFFIHVLYIHSHVNGWFC